MIEFSRCPKCATLYDLRKVDLSPSNGWVQCGECERKFKAKTYEVHRNEISFVEQPAEQSSPEKEDIKPQETTIQPKEKTRKPEQASEEYLDQQQIAMQEMQKESEFNELTITEGSLESRSISLDASYDELLDPEMLVEDVAFEDDVDKSAKRSNYEKLFSEFSGELIDIQPKEQSPEHNAYDELVSTAVTTSEIVEPPKTRSIFYSVPLALIFGALLALLGFQVHSRGTYEWIPEQSYEIALDMLPQLSYLEKDQDDLSKLHLASTRMEALADYPQGRKIILQVINKSRLNQAYPDFQLDFLDAKGKTIVRRLILPNMYLQQGHLGVLEAKEAKTLYFDLQSLPEGAAGYELKIVKQDS